MKFELVAPLLGFEEIKEVELQKIDDIFMKLESSQSKHISFTLIDPFALREYDFEISDAIKEKLQIDENTNILTLNIVLVQSPIENSVVNFVAPIIFNTDNNKAVQVILTDSTKYGVAEKISDFLKK